MVASQKESKALVEWDQYKMLKFKAITALAAVAALSLAGSAMAQTNGQFPQAPWNAFAPASIQCGWLYGANMNATTDQAIPISVPSGTWAIDSISISNPSISLTTAQGGFYTAASKGGVAVVASTQAYSTLTTNAANSTGNFMTTTLSTAGNTTDFQGPTQTSAIKMLYFSLTTAQGAAATADIRVRCRPLY
jgi:hypothetical protein